MKSKTPDINLALSRFTPFTAPVGREALLGTIDYGDRLVATDTVAMMQIYKHGNEPIPEPKNAPTLKMICEVMNLEPDANNITKTIDIKYLEKLVKASKDLGCNYIDIIVAPKRAPLFARMEYLGHCNGSPVEVAIMPMR